MQRKIINTLFPVLFGVLAVVGVLMGYNLVVHQGAAFSSPDHGFFKILVPLTTVIALAIQFGITLPLWTRFKVRKTVGGLTLVPFTALLCIASGVIFGLIFWERALGLMELAAILATGVVAFVLYWSVNLLTLSRLDK